MAWIPRLIIPLDETLTERIVMIIAGVPMNSIEAEELPVPQAVGDRGSMLWLHTRGIARIIGISREGVLVVEL